MAGWRWSGSGPTVALFAGFTVTSETIARDGVLVDVQTRRAANYQAILRVEVRVETTGTNAADTSPQTLPWTLASEDATYFTNATNWTSAFNTARYLQVTFPASVPSSATIDSVSFEHRYQAGSGSTICYYLEAWSGADPTGTAIRTYPSPPGTNGASCASGTASWVRDSISLPEIDTPAKVNGLVLRLYYRTSSGGATKSREDYAGLKIKYH